MREPQLGVAVGKKGVGKTFTTKKLIQSYITGNPARGIKPRKVLILDVNDEFTDIKALQIEHVKLFSAHPKVEARRVRPFLNDGKKMSLDEVAATLGKILHNYSGGLLIIEDINKYISDNMPSDLIGAICTNRHADMDIILHYQSIGRISTKVWQNLNWIRFHKNTDSVARHENKFPDKFQMLTLCETLVNIMYQTDKRYYCYVNVDEEKIQGNFSSKLINQVLDKYIEDNYSKLVTPLLRQKNLNGKGNKYTPQTAIEKLKTEITNSFFC